jgi:hypothetical protein
MKKETKEKYIENTNSMENNKSLMTLFRDFLNILADAEAASCFNTLDEILIEGDLRIKESDQNMVKWDQIRKEIEDYNDELNNYRLNPINNPAVYQGLALNKLSEYRIRTISGLKMIKRHALYTGGRTALLNQIAEDLRNSYRNLMNLIIEILEKKTTELPLLEEKVLNESAVNNDPPESVIKMFMNTSFNRKYMSREEAIEEAKKLGPALREQEQIIHLKEMSYLCKESDGYGMIMEIRLTDKQAKIGNKQSPGHAYIYDTNKALVGEIVVTRQKPTKPLEVIPYRCNLPVNYRNKIINWAKESDELGVNNWDYLYLISEWDRRRPD